MPRPWALTVSTLAGVVGAYAVARLARHCGAGRRGELIAVCLVAAAPMSVVYSMAYPEALLIALVSWGLVALLERRWWVAILCAAAAGYVSPMGAPFIPVVIAACLARTARTSWLTKLPALLTPAGIISYLDWVDVKSGVPGGFTAITHSGWGNKVDFGWGTLRWVYSAFTINPDAYSLLVAFGIIASVGLLVCARHRLPWLVWAYCLFTVLLAFGSGGMPQARMRLLLSAFPLLLPLAVSLDRGPARSAVPAIAGYTMFGLWPGFRS